MGSKNMENSIQIPDNLNPKIWEQNFSASKEFNKLPNYAKLQAESVVNVFLAHVEDLGASPNEWTEQVLDEVCLDLFIYKGIHSKVFYRSAGSALASFFTYIFNNFGYKKGLQLAKYMKSISREIQLENSNHLGQIDKDFQEEIEENIEMASSTKIAAIKKKMSPQLSSLTKTQLNLLLEMEKVGLLKI